MSGPYTSEFFRSLRPGSYRSAEALLPIVMDMLSPNSVVDVGCGDGSWLAVLSRHFGIEEVIGIDGPYIDRTDLQIPEERFKAVDLSKPFRLDRDFELAISLEVAEHLPAQAAATFVRSLTELAPVVLFSAAIPLQGGVQHLNEQWPDYWAQIFSALGYTAVDCIRPRIWMDDRISLWYRQNTVLYVRRDDIGLNHRLQFMADHRPSRILPLIHPDLYMARSRPLSLRVGELARSPMTVAKILSKRIGSMLTRRLGTKRRERQSV